MKKRYGSEYGRQQNCVQNFEKLWEFLKFYVDKTYEIYTKLAINRPCLKILPKPN